MKKIVKPTGNVRLVGQAEKDGVAFQVTKVNGPWEISLLGTLATVTENNDIICDQWNHKKDTSPIHAKIQKFSKTTLCIAGIFAILFLVAYYLSGIFTNSYILLTLSYIMISAVWICEAVGIFISKILGDKEIKSFSKFLAAKNAVENAFYHLGKVPTIQEAQTYSTISYYSKYISNSSSGISTLWFMMALTCWLPVPWYFLVFAVIFATILFFTRKNMFLFWQFLTVSKPEDIHYQAAIIALEEAFRFKDNIHISVEPCSKEEMLEVLQFNQKTCKNCPSYLTCKELFDSSK